MADPGYLDLDGDAWEIREALGLSWQWYLAAPPVAALNSVAVAAIEAEHTTGWIPARVPGSVIRDLADAGELPDPYAGRNSRAAEWVAERSWVYRRTVRIAADNRHVVLEIDGIDPSGRVYWDGTLIGEVSGLYHSARIDLGDRATPGDHLLAIVVGPAPPSEPQVGRTELVRTHSPRMNYGWDFSPRMRHQGIWRSMRLRTDQVQFSSVSVRTEVDDRGELGIVMISVALDGPANVQAELIDGDRVIAQLRSHAGEFALKLASPRLWNPLGYGEQHLYRVRLKAGTAERTVSVGFRSIRMEANAGGPADALPYSTVVNGVRVPLVGWNWVPADTLYGSIERDRLTHLLALAAASGGRVLRVWGGGIIESEEFYDECDRLGILVWQEFSQSSSGMQSAPATDPEFVALLRDEAERIVPTRTHHPSLWMWGGGNELDEGGVPLDEDRSPALRALKEVVQRRDPGRAWLPTSPSGPAFHNRLDEIATAPDSQHDVHGPWEHQGLEGQHTLYNAGSSLAHTEFGVEGMTNARALEALIPEPHRWPADRSNPYYRHLGDWWNNADLVNDCFGGGLHDLESLRRASQFLQAAGLAYAIEADRRRAPRLSMVLPWQLDESYPNAWCTSAVDYLGEPKPAYFAAARAFAPTRVTARTDRTNWAGYSRAAISIWVWAEHGIGADTVVTARARDPLGGILATRQFEVAATSEPREVGVFDFAIDGVADIFAWELEWRTGAGDVLDREVVVATSRDTLAGLLTLTPASVETTIDWAGRVAEVTIRHVAGPLIPGLRIRDARPQGDAGRLLTTGDPRPLLPAEERVIVVNFTEAGGDHGAVLEGWNLAEITIGRLQ